MIRHFWKVVTRVRNAIARGVVVNGSCATDLACAAQIWRSSQRRVSAAPKQQVEVAQCFVDSLVSIVNSGLQYQPQCDLSRWEGLVFNTQPKMTQVRPETSKIFSDLGRHKLNVHPVQHDGQRSISKELTAFVSEHTVLGTKVLDDWGSTFERWRRAVDVVHFCLHLSSQSVFVNK